MRQAGKGLSLSILQIKKAEPRNLVELSKVTIMNPGLEPRASELESGTCKLSNLVTALYICTVQINEQGQVIQISICSHIKVHLLVLLCSSSLRGRYTFRSNTQHNVKCWLTGGILDCTARGDVSYKATLGVRKALTQPSCQGSKGERCHFKRYWGIQTRVFLVRNSILVCNIRRVKTW